MNRQQRRRSERLIRKLMMKDACSLCGRKFEHGASTFGGLDRCGNVAYTGECCVRHLVEISGRGLFSTRDYDFLTPRENARTADSKPVSLERIDEVVTAYQAAVAETDKWVNAVERRSGATGRYPVKMRDYPWKDDDRTWFECHPTRAHRVRMPFPGEADDVAAEAPADHVLIIPVRQLEPGARIRGGFYLRADMMPVPDDEAIAHALFDIAERREPVPANGGALAALLEKYRATHDGDAHEDR